ncbi:unnamed protein product [Rotaria sp. Silwood2]|nr:unnamed protein product [Rotaria sp. Silwood2]CAF3962712.1 unnamed protein product [Rotaria sp. Silwood2]
MSAISPCARWNIVGTTIAGTGTAGNGSNQLDYPEGLFIHKPTNTLYVVDSFNSRIQSFLRDQSSNISTIVIPNLRYPSRIYLDDGENVSTIYATDSYPLYCGVQWVVGAPSGVSLGDKFSSCRGISIDKEKSVFLTDWLLDILIKESPGMNDSIVIAGKPKECNSTSKHFCGPSGIFVDQTSGTVYVADTWNNRIQKWLKNAQEGITVAGSSNGSYGHDAASLYSPQDVFVDIDTSVLYIADGYNGRIQR